MHEEKSMFRIPSSKVIPMHNSFHSSSVISLTTLYARMKLKRPIVTRTSRPKANQPRTIEDEPTPLRMLPLPKSCATVLAATEAVCCQSTDTRTKTEAMKMRASATCETAREGTGLTSFSEPDSSISSCHPGNVARRTKQKNERITATILHPVREDIK